MRLSAGEEIRIASGPYAAGFAPAAGGRLTRLEWSAAGATHALVVPLEKADFDQHRWPKAGAFPMAPFANRVPRAGFFFEGRWRAIAAAPGESFAQHGFAHRRPWRVLDATGERALFEYAHEGGDEGWDWPFSIRQEAEIGEGGLAITFKLLNLADEPMPAGMGWHPYHLFRERAGVVFRAAERVPLDAEGRAASGEEISPDGATTKVAAGETVAFAGWEGEAVIPVAGGLEAVVTATGWSNLVVHRPADSSYICLEPVMLLPGRLGDPGRHDHGLGVLLPGASVTARWRCEARSAAA